MTKRKAVEENIYRIMDIMDPSKTNSKRMRAYFAKMDDGEFDAYMRDIKEKKRKTTLIMPNMVLTMNVDNMFKAAEYLGINLVERIWITDSATGREFLTPRRYMVLRLPVRRLKQYLEDKMSVPTSDKTINLTTGQVLGPDKGSSISSVEAQAIDSKGLGYVLHEFLNVRGGNIPNYAQLKSQAEETGSAQLDTLDPTNVVRSAVVAQVNLQSMHIDNNLTGGRV